MQQAKKELSIICWMFIENKCATQLAHLNNINNILPCKYINLFNHLPIIMGGLLIIKSANP